MFVKTHTPDKYKNEDEFEAEAEAGNDLKVGDLLQFDFETIRLATNNFSDENMIGQGGFGAVYKVKKVPFFLLKYNAYIMIFFLDLYTLKIIINVRVHSLMDKILLSKGWLTILSKEKQNLRTKCC